MAYIGLGQWTKAEGLIKKSLPATDTVEATWLLGSFHAGPMETVAKAD